MFRFTIRELVLLTLVVVLAVGWVNDRFKLSSAETKVRLYEQGVMPEYLNWPNRSVRNSEPEVQAPLP